MNEKDLTVALFALLERENTVSIPQLAAMLGTDEQMVWNLLEELVFAYDSVALRLELGDAHATLLRDGTTRLFRLNATETGILLDLLEAQGVGADSELSRKLVSAKGMLAHAQDVPVSSMRTIGTGVPEDVAVVVAQACEDQEHHLLEIEYCKDGESVCETRVVEPYMVRADQLRSYLEAYDTQRRGWRSFRLDRIRQAQASVAVFAPRPLPESFDFDEDTRGVVRFAPGVELPSDWTGLRKLRQLEDGSTEASVPWYSSRWLPKKIVGMLGKAQPLRPPELVEACRDYAQEIVGRP